MLSFVLANISLLVFGQDFSFGWLLYKLCEALAALALILCFHLSLKQYVDRSLNSFVLLVLAIPGMWLTQMSISSGFRSFFQVDEVGSALGQHQAIMHQNYPQVRLLVTLLIGPLSEELLYRAFGIQQLRKSLPISFAIVITAIAFAAMHYSGGGIKNFVLIDLIPLTAYGLVLGLLFVRYGIVGSILAHSGFNTLAYYKNYLLDFLWFLPFCFVGVMAFAFILITIFRGKTA